MNFAFLYRKHHNNFASKKNGKARKLSLKGWIRRRQIESHFPRDFQVDWKFRCIFHLLWFHFTIFSFLSHYKCKIRRRPVLIAPTSPGLFHPKEYSTLLLKKRRRKWAFLRILLGRISCFFLPPSPFEVASRRDFSSVESITTSKWCEYKKNNPVKLTI